MKVRGPDATKNTSKTGKKSGDSGKTDGASFGSMVAGEAQQKAGVSNAHSITQLDSLLAIQAAEDPLARQAKKRMRQRSTNILDLLDRLRMKMLSGQLTLGDMIDVADVVASHREKIDDPILTDILDEIDLRAQVELAKIRVVLDAKKAR